MSATGSASPSAADVIGAWAATAEAEGMSRIVMFESQNGDTNNRISAPMLTSPESTYSPFGPIFFDAAR